jgi:prepilin-type N-terminal cleavage/methylation domain-containing protein
MRKNSGFTLIEMIVYIGLFGIIMAGLVTTSFHLTESARGTSSKVATEEEINFVLKKLDWALTGADSSTIVTADLPDELKFKNTKISPNFIIFSLNADGDIEMEKNSTALLLTTKNVKVGSLQFTYDSSTKIVTATFVIDNVSSKVTKLLKI